MAICNNYLAAIEDFELIGKMEAELPKGDRPAAPSWLGLIEALLRFDSDRLERARGGPDGELAALLHMVSLEQPHHSDVALRAGHSAIEANPECFRAHDAVCEVSGVANLHVATELAPAVLTRMMPDRIASMPGMPEKARVAAVAANEAEVTRALDESAVSPEESVEPSWGALAKMVRETRFLFTYYRLNFMSVIWHVPTDDYWQEVLPLVEQHRFRPFLESFVKGARTPGLEEFSKNFDATDIDIRFYPMFQRVKSLVPSSDFYAYNGLVLLLSEWNTRDLSRMVSGLHGGPRALDYARKLMAISPNCPFAMAELIEFAWPEAEKRFDSWRKVVGNHPTFLASVARRQGKLGEDEQAETTLKAYINKSADLWAYEQLAAIYQKRGDKVAWKATIDEFLNEVDDHGLEHA
jgi:hypothetical protein